MQASIEGSAVPSGRGFVRLLEAFRATGGTVPSEVVARLLELHQAGHAVSLSQLISTGRAFGFEWRSSLWIPMFQFSSDDLTLQDDVQRVRAELPPQWSGWTMASWFALPSAALEGHCPADTMHSDFEAVMRAACARTGPEHRVEQAHRDGDLRSAGRHNRNHHGLRTVQEHAQ